MSWQTKKTKTRLLLEEQSVQGLHCLPPSMRLFEAFSLDKSQFV